MLEKQSELEQKLAEAIADSKANNTTGAAVEESPERKKSKSGSSTSSPQAEATRALLTQAEALVESQGEIENLCETLENEARDLKSRCESAGDAEALARGTEALETEAVGLQEK